MTSRTRPRAFISIRVAALALMVAPWLTAAPVQSQAQNRGQGVRKQVSKLPESAKRWALVIGIDEYSDPSINRLNGAVNDAKTLADALVEYAGFPQIGRAHI